MSETPNEEIERIVQKIQDLGEAADDLRELGRENNIPAVERNAKRVQSVVEILEADIPQELTED